MNSGFSVQRSLPLYARVAFALEMLSDNVDIDDGELSGYCHMIAGVLRDAVDGYERSKEDEL